ncbi:hypothetical protein WAI453_010039 [Rhynchosporium graminicola]
MKLYTAYGKNWQERLDYDSAIGQVLRGIKASHNITKGLKHPVVYPVQIIPIEQNHTSPVPKLNLAHSRVYEKNAVQARAS